MRRRTALRLAGLGAVGSLAGCSTDGNPGGNGDGDDPEIADTETIQLTTRDGRPRWHRHESDQTGHVVVMHSEARTAGALNQYTREMAQDRADELDEFMESVDYDTDRLLLVESMGPTGCYDRVEVENAGVEDGVLGADATAADASEDDGECAEEVTYPSSLTRVVFEDRPLDEASIAVTDGWGETAAVEASTSDSLSPDPVDLPGHIHPEDDEPEPVEPLECDDEEFVRHDQRFEEDAIRMGDLEQDGEVVLSIRVGDMEYERGETLDVALTNVSDREIETGNSAKYNLQVYTQDGWQDVRGGDDGEFSYTDEAVVLYPGDGFEWSLELTESGVVDGGFHDLRVCPGLERGRYRFAFWGLADADAGAIVVEFDLID